MLGELNEDRVIALAEQLEAGRSVRVSDPTGTVASLTQVGRAARRELEAAAELAGVRIELSKVGDEARARVIA